MRSVKAAHTDLAASHLPVARPSFLAHNDRKGYEGQLGNQAMLRRLSSTPPRLQRKLTIGAVNDPLEAEADHVADQVMRMPDPGVSLSSGSRQVSRKCAACEEEDKKLQAKPDGSLPRGEMPPIVHEVLNSSGQPLDSATRAYFEPRFGWEFSQVRIHADDRAAASAQAVNARAYTVGSRIVLGAGNSPQTRDGQRLLAHELGHVVQYSGSASRNAHSLSCAKQSTLGGSAQTVRRQATNDPAPGPGSADLSTQQTTQPDPTQRQGQPGEADPQSSGPGKSGGKPDPSIPDCTAVMGGRTVDYWLAKIAGAQHTFMNFKLDSSNYWLVEGGPLSSDPKKSGAWAKAGDWDTRGPRQTKTFDKGKCSAIKDCMLDATARYNSAGVAYDPTDGPNSNSFMEQLTFTCNDLPRTFTDNDVAWDYWDKPRAGQIHTRRI